MFRNHIFNIYIYTIAIYMNMWNGHSILLWNIHIYNIEHRNPKMRKTPNNFSVQVQNFLLPLSLKVLRHKEGDTHSFYSGFFICPPHLVRHLPRASASKWKSTLFVRCPVLNSTDFFKIPKSSARFQCMTSFALPSPISHLGLLWHLWVTCPLHPRARVNTCINVAPK